MPQNYPDPDQWLANKRKSTAPQVPAATPSLDPDAWIAKRRQKPKAARVTPPAEIDYSDRNVVSDQPSMSDFMAAQARADTENPESRYRMQREEFSQKPFLERTGRRALESFTRGGGTVSRVARQTLGAANKAIGSSDLDAWLENWRKSDQNIDRILEERRLGRPEEGLLTQTGEAIAEALPSVGAVGGAAALTGGGAIPLALIGGGYAAASIPSEQWRSQPGRSALQTGVGAIAPVAGGRIGQAVGGRVASRLAAPVAKRLAAAGGEVLGGGTGNVLGAVAMGERNPRELIKTGMIGMGLSLPGAMKAGRRLPPPGRPTSPTETRPTQPLPAEFGPYPDIPTTEMPAVRERIAAENAPTSAGMRLQPALANYEAPSLPELYSAELPPYEVSTGKLGKSYPGAVGPKVYDELGFQAGAGLKPQAGQQAKARPYTPILEQISAARKAGLLTNPSTHARNLGGSGIKQAADEISRIPASILDLAISTVNRQRTVSGPSLTAMARSAKQAATQGAKDAWQVIKNGATPQQLQQMGLSEINSQLPILNTYVRGVFRLMGAGDAFMKSYAARRALIDRALSLARTEARMGRIPRSQIKQRADQLVARPPADLEVGAIEDSLTATFNQENRFADMIAGAKEKGGQLGRFAIDTVIPYPKTPSNALASLFEYAGGGALKAAKIAGEALWKRSFSPAQQRALTMSLGRAVTGAGGLITAGYILGSKGYLTGFGEEDEGRRNRDIASGRQPASIYNPISGEWTRISGFNPISTLLIVGATIHREHSRSGEKREKGRFERYAGIGADIIGEHPLSIGAKETAEMLTKPSTLGKNVGAIAGSFVPSAVSGIGAAIDDKEREGRGVLGQVEKRVPYLRESLPEATDVLGRPLEHRRFDALNPAPGSIARDKTQTLEAELVRLDVGLTAPRRKTEEGETDADYRTRKALAGRWFQNYAGKLMESRSYRSASREEQKAAWGRLLRAVHDESDNPEPNTERFNAGAIIESVRESIYQKQARQKR